MKRLTPEQIIENNKKIIAENNLKNLNEVVAYTLKARLSNKEEN